MNKDIETETLQVFLSNVNKYSPNREIVFVTGRPGSGKSTYIKFNKLENEYCLVDTDLIKNFIMEKYNIDLHKDAVVHAYRVRHRLLIELMSLGYPIIYPTTINIQTMYEYIDIAWRKGYKIKIFHLNTSKEVSVENCIKRSMDDKSRNLHLKWLNYDFYDKIPEEFANKQNVSFEIVQVNKFVY